MDLWVLAAAAGAGCIAKYLNKLSKNGDTSTLSSSLDSNFDNSEFPTCNDSGVLLSKFNDTGYGYEQSPNFGGNSGFLLPDLSEGNFGSVHSPSGNKTSTQTKRSFRHISKPSTSLESCLMAQLCKEHDNMEESVSSSSMAKRSFVVRDGIQMISRANDGDSLVGLTGSEDFRLHREDRKVTDESVLYGVPPLPKIESFNCAKKMIFDAGKGRSRRLRPSNNVFSGKHIHNQHDETFIFSLGMSFGMITSVLANKREMDTLREMLKQVENLVQDLHEQLEMKDSMTVKELNSGNYGSQDTCDHSFCDREVGAFSPEKHTDNSSMTACKKSHDLKEEEGSESMSKIEAELEAELERLGLNMNESSPERPLSDIDPDFEADFAQGELQTEVIGGKYFVHSKLNEDASETMIPVNYAVSAHELSLRLHEVIQSRLEEHVQELEIALENSQRKLRFMESEYKSHSQKYLSSCGQSPSLTKGKQLTYDDSDPTTEPLVMNLSDAYNDTYEEIIKIGDYEENSPSSIHNTDDKVDSCSHDLHVLGVQLCGVNDLLSCTSVDEDRLSRKLSSGEVTMFEAQSSSIYEVNDVTGDENCECDYMEERQLIKQIVERTKKGSPVFQNARRILYSRDEDEQTLISNTF